LSIPITVASNLNVLDTLNTSSLAAGHHTLHVRALDEDGVWSEVESRAFFVDAFAAGGITGVEYFFDADPGIGGSTTIAINPAQANIDSTIAFAATALSAGPHVMGIRLVNENGLFGMTEYLNITLCDGANAAILADTICIGASTLFTDKSTNVVAGDIYSWDFDNDGSEDSNIQGDQSFAYASAGTYFAKLSIDRIGCTSVDSIEVTVVDLPVANAGVDQALCTTDAVLAADPLNANEVGSWSVFSGSAVIVDPANPASDVNSIANNSVVLIWEVNNTLGGCSAFDTVVINANLPITAQRQTNSVNIGQSSIVDVQSMASINPGDVLTTTITTSPLYGVASVLPAGTIDYSPDLDAAALDSVQYRITNQCLNFSENYIVYSIINAPPVVQNQLPSPQTGSTSVNIDLGAFITDPNNNVDLASIIIITQPISGAIASIDGSGNLTIDYSGITFTGDDMLEIQVCDLTGVCVVQAITIPNVEVGGENPPILVFNGVSPDGDGFNDFLEIENIEAYPNNTVIILNRWGAELDRFTGYNNQNIIFDRSDLPSGTYYYHILPGIPEVEPVTGHFLLINDQ
jgi:gliding motility-associated-like protein